MAQKRTVRALDYPPLSTLLTVSTICAQGISARLARLLSAATKPPKLDSSDVLRKTKGDLSGIHKRRLNSVVLLTGCLQELSNDAAPLAAAGSSEAQETKMGVAANPTDWVPR